MSNKIVLVFLFLALIGCSQNLTVEEGRRMPTIEELTKAHKYHGILFSYEKEDGKWYFKRDNKECKLFKYLEG